MNQSSFLSRYLSRVVIACCFLASALGASAATASLLLNELNPNLQNNHDLIELVAVKAGNTQGITVEQIGTVTEVLATLPSIEVALGDLIVIHLNPPGTTGIAPASETVAKTESPNATFSANYDGAWDVLGGNIGGSYAYRVVVVRQPGGAIQDAVPFYIVTGTPPAAFPSNLQSIQAQGLWNPADCGGALCTYGSTPTATDVSVNWSGMGTTIAGNSIQRRSLADANNNSEWVVLPSTFGVLNTNQAVLFMVYSSGAVTLSYAASPGFVLEQTSNLTSGPWTNGPAGNPTAPIPVTGAARFFRLRKQ